jgi:hypothetical protein
MRFLVVICVLFLSFSTHAQNLNIKIHSSDSAAVGYADVSVGGPANKALDKEKSGFTALSLDARGTLSEGLGAFVWVNDVIDFKDSFSSALDVLYRYDQLVNLVSRSNWDLGATTRLDLLTFRIAGEKLGYLSIGAYTESSVGIMVRAPKVDDIKIVKTWLDVGQDTDVLRGQGSADGGVEVGYGRLISLPHELELSVGIQNRVFYRFNVPEHAVMFNKELRDEGDISVPDFSYHNGWGFGADLFASLDLNDQYLDTRFSVEVRNALCFVWYDKSTQRDMVQFGIGTSISPLKLIDLESFRVLADLEVYENGITSVHAGALWRLGNQRFHFTPSIGSALVGIDVWGNTYRSITAGFSAKVAVLELAGVFEYIGSGRYDAGARVAVSW